MDTTMNSVWSSIRIFAVLPAVVLLAGCVTAQDIWRQYSQGGNHKAYATSSNGSVGAAWGAYSKKEAIRLALDYCYSGGGIYCEVKSLDGRHYDPASLETKVEPAPSPVPVPQPKLEPELSSTGSGFFITIGGLILTNAHVVADCAFSRIRYQDRVYDVTLTEIDLQNDLALLHANISELKIAQLETSRNPRLGESVVAFGYPLSSVLSSKPKVTDGILSSTAGLNDDSRYFQISTPVQPGNSGGPLIDSSGRVIGIITAQLSDSWSVQNLGTIPQNVNFAIKSNVIETFLDSHSIVTKKPNKAASKLSLPDIAESADTYTVQIACFR